MRIQGIRPLATVVASRGKKPTNANTTFSLVFNAVGRPQNAVGNRETKPLTQAAVFPHWLSQKLEGYVRGWQVAEKNLAATLARVSPEYRSVVELQLTVHRLNLETEVMSRMGDALGSSIRRIEQMGNT